MKPELVPFFKNEQEGSYRGDICKGVILFETGGLYLDIDIRPLVSVLKLFSNSSSDVATGEMDDKLSFFNAIIYVPKASKLMIIYLEKLSFLYELLVLYTESGKYLLHRVWYIYEQEVKGGHFSWIA